MNEEKEHNTTRVMSYSLRFEVKQKLLLPLGTLPISVSYLKGNLVLNVLETINETRKEEFRIDINTSGDRTTYLPRSTYIGSVVVEKEDKNYIMHVFYSKKENKPITIQKSIQA